MNDEKSIHDENVETVIRGMEILNDVTELIEITKKEIEEIVFSLKNKKAVDRCGWTHELVKRGGKEMKRSSHMYLNCKKYRNNGHS